MQPNVIRMLGDARLPASSPLSDRTSRFVAVMSGEPSEPGEPMLTIVAKEELIARAHLQASARRMRSPNPRRIRLVLPARGNTVTSARRPPGELESQVLHTLWDHHAALTAREIQSRMPGPHPAHTTILTALERLRDKGHVVRIGDEQRNVRWTATRTEEEHAGTAMLQRLGAASDREATLLHFAGNLQPADLDVLRKALGGGASDDRAR